jgi:phosphoglycerate dehydrogenase-like enzyme
MSGSSPPPRSSAKTNTPRGDQRRDNSTSRQGTATRTVAVAAPPWAARALTDTVEKALNGIAVRHVVIGDVPVDKEEAEGVEVLWRYHLDPQRLESAVRELPDLRWVHSDYVGVENLPLELLAERGIMLSNGAGIVARPMAEWVVLAILSCAKDLPRFVRQSDAGRWEVGAPLADIKGAVVLLLGLGAVNTLVAGLLAPFGADVRACTRHPRPKPPAGVSRVVSAEAWRGELGEADHVVCALPLTAETSGMLDAAAFAAMKKGAFLINVARGGLVDDDALVEALESGHLRGAVLDAFRHEPVETGHPLWGRPDVLALPHVTWSSTHMGDDMKDRFAAQLTRWLSGSTPEDLVDLVTGY